MIPPHAAKLLLIDVESDTEAQIRANLPAAYSILVGDHSSAATAAGKERPDLVILGAGAAEERSCAVSTNGKTIPVIALTGKGTKPGDDAAGGEICRCAGEPLDVLQLKDCVRRALAGAAAFPDDVESLIKSTVEELVEEGMPLGRALQRFTARFSDWFLSRGPK